MRVKLVGKQYLDFTTEEGEKIQGTKLHVVSATPENDKSMQGCYVAAIFTKLNVSAIPVNSDVDLVYEQRLGSNKSRLVAVNLIK